MKKLVLIIIALLSVCYINAQDNLNLNLEDCRTKAIENSEKLKIADATIDKANAEKMSAKSAWFPNVYASATGIYNEINIEEEIYMPTMVLDPTTGQLVPNVAINPMTGHPIMGPDGNPVFNMYGYMPLEMTINGGFMAGVTMEQPIYTGGKIITGNNMANVGTEMAYTNMQLEQSQIIFNADQAYYTYLSVKEKVKLAKKYKELLEEAKQMVGNSYNIGMANMNDKLKVDVQYNEACLQVQKAESGLELCRMSICQIIGVDFNTVININDSITIETFDPATLIQYDVRNRLEFQLLENRVKMSELNVKMAKSDYLPSAGISMGYNYTNINIQDMDNYDTNGFRAIVNIKIPITKFGEGIGKRNSAESDFIISQMELQQAGEFLQLEFEQARLNLLDAHTRIGMTENALIQADENVRVSSENYKIGMENITNLMEAQTEWQKAYNNYIDAKTDFKIKESYYLKITNKSSD